MLSTPSPDLVEAEMLPVVVSGTNGRVIRTELGRSGTLQAITSPPSWSRPRLLLLVFAVSCFTSLPSALTAKALL